MDGIPAALPALAYAAKVQKKAASQGVDWRTLLGGPATRWPRACSSWSTRPGPRGADPETELRGRDHPPARRLRGPPRLISAGSCIQDGVLGAKGGSNRNSPGGTLSCASSGWPRPSSLSSPSASPLPQRRPRRATPPWSSSTASPTRVDVYVDDELTLDDFTYETVTDPLSLPAGRPRRWPSGPPTPTRRRRPILAGRRHARRGRQRLRRRPPRRGRRADAHPVRQRPGHDGRRPGPARGAPHGGRPAVDVLAGGEPVFTRPHNPNEAKADLPAGTVSAAVALAGTTDPVIGPADVPVTEGSGHDRVRRRLGRSRQPRRARPDHRRPALGARRGEHRQQRPRRHRLRLRQPARSRSPWPPRWRPVAGRAGPPPPRPPEPPGAGEGAPWTPHPPPPLAGQLSSPAAPPFRAIRRRVSATDRPRHRVGDARVARAGAGPRRVRCGGDRTAAPPVGVDVVAVVIHDDADRSARSRRPPSGRRRGGSMRSRTPPWWRRWRCASPPSASTRRCAPVGVRADGEMEVPAAADVGWYRFGPPPAPTARPCWRPTSTTTAGAGVFFGCAG